MDKFQVSSDDWLILSPLLDEAIELPSQARTDWLEKQNQLSARQLQTLQRLLAHHEAPETNTIINPKNLEAFRVKARLRSARKQREAGDRVGPYQLLRQIGEGGMGDVWLARRIDGTFERDVALKVCRATDSSLRVRDRMIRERDVLASLEHPNIARFYDAGVDADEQPYIAMEYIDGVALKEYVAANALSVEEECRILIEVLAAVHFAHQRLVVHRDLKPSNIMVRTDGSISLLDFGIAKVLDESDGQGAESELTRDAGYALTPAYASPEQCAGSRVSTATDVFSCGAIFYELLAGYRPFQEYESNLGRLLEAQRETLKPIAAPLPMGHRRDLNAIVSCALRDQPSERYESASTFADDIRRFLGNEPVRAVRGARWYRVAKFVKRNRGGVLLAAASLCAVLASSAVLFFLYQQSEEDKLRAQNTERIMSGIFAGFNPVSSDAQAAHPKELLDRSVDALGTVALDPQIAQRIANVYLRMDLPNSALSVIENSLSRAQSIEDASGQARLFASAAQLQAQLGNTARADELLNRARRIADHPRLFFDSATRWNVALATARIQIARDQVPVALDASNSALRLAHQIGGNSLDAVTTTINQLVEIKTSSGDWSGVLRSVSEADAIAAKYGEMDPLLAATRALAAANAHVELGDAAAAKPILSRHYADAKKRYPLTHVNRIESGLMLADALTRLGESAEASRMVNEMSPPTVSALIGNFANMWLRDMTVELKWKADSTGTSRPTISPEQALCRARDLFFSSVLRGRADLRRVLLQVELAMVAFDRCTRPGQGMYKTSFEEFVRLRVTPALGPAKIFEFAPIDRSKLGISYAHYIAESGNDAVGEAQLQLAEDLLDGKWARTALVLADAQIAHAALKLRRQDFAGATRLLQLAQENGRDQLPVGNPRLALLETYLSIAKLGARGTAASEYDGIAKAVSDKLKNVGPASVESQFTAWLKPSATRDWAQLPLVRL